MAEASTKSLLDLGVALDTFEASTKSLLDLGVALDTFEDSVSVETFKTRVGSDGILIKWSEKGRGFGEYTFYKEGDQGKCDNEGDTKEDILRIFTRFLDSVKLDD